MYVVTEYPDGIFCWIDVSTTDPEAAKAFYTGLFGWEAEDRPTDMGPVYTMMLMDGKSVAGLGPLSPNLQAQGVPAFWTGYIKSSDVDATAARVTEAGGVVIMPPMDVMSQGRLMMAQDPTGAMFGVWQPRNHHGSQLVNMPNTLVWTELQTRATAQAIPFYAHVFGWTETTDDTGYTVFAQNGRRHAGMFGLGDSMPNVPSNWALYFMVADLGATLANAQALGGRVLVPPTPAGAMGDFAVLQDPQGAVFTVMQIDPAYVDPPPGA